MKDKEDHPEPIKDSDCSEASCSLPKLFYPFRDQPAFEYSYLHTIESFEIGFVEECIQKAKSEGATHLIATEIQNNSYLKFVSLPDQQQLLDHEIEMTRKRLEKLNNKKIQMNDREQEH